ncbi:Neprilysin-1 [Lamellibrachia satsuma]|nr:Neprilysin-1 [Lamellibrachia satsuma]
MIGYPEEIMDDNYLDLQYKQLHLQEGTFYENIVNIWKIDIKNNLKKINERVDRNEWVRGTGPTKTNAFYAPRKNNIVIPAAFLQPPIYSETYPKSVSFGGIGFVVGHELTHGFDDLGRQFDINGNAKQWWSKEVIEKFNQRAQCIVNQYSSYTVSEVGMNVNGKLTLGENIADNGGLKESFFALRLPVSHLSDRLQAYRNWVSRQGREEDVLPGLNLDNNQLFFLSFAQMRLRILPRSRHLSLISPEPDSTLSAPQSRYDRAIVEIYCLFRATLRS